jgi:hypothetical protein
VDISLALAILTWFNPSPKGEAMKTKDMLMSHPRKSNIEMKDVTACISACIECASVCTACADACLAEQDVQSLVTCIRIDLDCADICETTARILTRQTDPNVQLVRAQLEATLSAVGICATECEKHAEMHKHCRLCASACRDCEQQCQQLISSLPAGKRVAR